MSANAAWRLEDFVDSLVVEPFDGANWEANAATLAHLSQAAKAGSESN